MAAHRMRVAAGTTRGGEHVSAEIAVLTNALVALLSPLLPYIVKFGEGAAGQAGARFSEQVVDRARVLWRRLRGDLAEPERIERAAEEAADDERFVAAVELELRQQVEQALRTDPTLAAALRELLGEWPGQIQVVPAEQNIGVQQSGTVTGGKAIGIGKVERR
jgi:hypothetical protein